MNTSTIMLLTALLGVAGTQPTEAASARREPNGAIRYYDDNGSDRGYAWCLNRGGRFGSGGSEDCSYYTFQQCQLSRTSSFSSYCVRNPWAAQVTQQRRR